MFEYICRLFMSHSDLLTALFTGCLAITAIFQLLLFFWQLRIMRQNLDDSKSIAKISNEAAQAAKQTANALIYGQRAYIGVRAYTEFKNKKYGNKIEFKVSMEMENTGNLPARSIENCVDYLIFEGNDLPEDFKFPCDEKGIIGSVLAPKAKILSSYVPKDGLIEIADLESINLGKKASLFLAG